MSDRNNTARASVPPCGHPATFALVVVARRLLLVAPTAALVLAVGACGGDSSPNGGPTDPCGGVCLTELGEVCNEQTGQCFFPEPDADAGDVGPDVPDIVEAGEPDVGLVCASDDECDDNEYCGGDGECVAGCRLTPFDNCTDCAVFPAVCEEAGIQCSPTDRVCVTDCIRDNDCPFTQFCDVGTGLCMRGCRDNPDNCAGRTGSPDFSCNPTIRACIGGSCTSNDECIDGAYCDSGSCFWGCRVDDDCGSGEACDGATRECQPLECGQDEDCDQGGPVTGLYCDPGDGICLFGCRFFDGGGDNCRPGTVCDGETRSCVDGCFEDAACPTGTYCEVDLELEEPGTCVNGCKEGDCPPPTFCDLGSRDCVTQACSVDGDCPSGTFCDGVSCIEGCRTDDPSTTEADEDTCNADLGLVCNADSRRCTVPVCLDDLDCPLGTVCVDESCVVGCGGDDDRCPPSQPCSSQTQQCGCLRDGDCPEGTHCATPACEPDCTPDNAATVDVDEDTCAAPLSCDPESGTCRAGCIDGFEDVTRNDFPGDATCTLFAPADQSDPNQLSLCGAGESQLSLCDDDVGTWCQSGVACTGQDEDWYTMFLYPGDSISASAELASAEAAAQTTFVMVLTFESNPIQVIRTATRTDATFAFSNVVAAQTGQYFLRLFAIDDNSVPYDLRIEVDRVFLCRADLYDPANDVPVLAEGPNPGAPLLENTDAVRSQVGLSICGADRDFFGIDLFAGNEHIATVDPDQADEVLNLALSVTNAGEDDLVSPPTASGVLDTETPDTNDVRLGLGSVPITDTYFLRVTSSDPEGETFYDLTYQTLQGAASCENDLLEPNDTAAEALSNNDVRFRIENPIASQSFDGARICPAEGEDLVDVDYFRVALLAGREGGFLTAAVRQDVGGPLRVEILDDAENVLAGPSSGEITTPGALDLAGDYFVRVTLADSETIPWQGLVYDLRLEYTPTSCDNDPFEDNDEFVRSTPLHASTLLGEGDECGGLAFSDACAPDEIGEGPLCLCDNTAGLRLCPADEDWYRFSMLLGDSFSIKVTPDAPSAPSDILGLLYPPSCVAGDTGCDGLVFLASDGSALLSPEVAVEPVAGGGVVLEYFLNLTHITGDAIDYEVLVEVQGTGSRDCPGDAWDEENLALYPGPNDIREGPNFGCGESVCTLSLVGDNNTRSGNLCFWDQQDWFRFEVTEVGADRLLLVEFFEDEGRIQGSLYRETAGGPVLVDPLLERDNDRLDPPGWDRVFYDLPAGFYQLEVHMPGRDTPGFSAGTSPNTYDVFLESAFCGDGIWSNDEPCDPFAPVSDAVMCGSGSSCTASCVCD